MPLSPRQQIRLGDFVMEPGQLVRHDAVKRMLRISRITDLSPGFRRLTLSGSEVDGFVSLGPADHVKVFLGDDVRRDFTPRAFRAADDTAPAELDIDFYLHGDGAASTWAATASIGDSVAIAGPRGSRLPPTGASRVILGADESALPAMARWIEMLPDDVEILGFVELGNASDAAYLDPEHVHKARILWLEKDGGLERALRGVGSLDANTFLWMAGEATTLVTIRRYLRRELSLPRDNVKIDGYWKRGESGRDHHAPVDPSDPDD